MLEYSLPEDRKIAASLHGLFLEWEGALEASGYFQREGLSPDCFVEDGIFPGYSGQRIKVLFMGRESYELEGFNYIAWHHEQVKARSFNGKALNQAGTWRKLLKFAWGLAHGAAWEAIPAAEELADEFAEPAGFSFAMVNVSKISRPWAGSTKVNWDLIRRFAQASFDAGPHFYQRQLNLLQPDLVISMNLADYLDERVFGGGLEFVEKPDPNVAVFNLSLAGKKIPLLDTWHFSASKSEAGMYESLRRAAAKA